MQRRTDGRNAFTGSLARPAEGGTAVRTQNEQRSHPGRPKRQSGAPYDLPKPLFN
jgi:hypothetical protein